MFIKVYFERKQKFSLVKSNVSIVNSSLKTCAYQILRIRLQCESNNSINNQKHSDNEDNQS